MSIYSYTFDFYTFKMILSKVSFSDILRNDYLDHIDTFGENFYTFMNDTFESVWVDRHPPNCTIFALLIHFASFFTKWNFLQFAAHYGQSSSCRMPMEQFSYYKMLSFWMQQRVNGFSVYEQNANVVFSTWTLNRNYQTNNLNALL